MSNIVGHGARADLPEIMMSNGLTMAFINVLSIAASALANVDRERRMAVWLAVHDQGVFGSGCVGFDISDFPWPHASFDEDKAFLLAVIQAAMNRLDWHKLNYAPTEDYLFAALTKFQALVQQFEREHILPEEELELREEPMRYELCPQHAVYLHVAGCVLCNTM